MYDFIVEARTFDNDFNLFTLCMDVLLNINIVLSLTIVFLLNIQILGLSWPGLKRLVLNRPGLNRRD